MIDTNLKAVIFDMGGVLLRTVDPAPRQALAERMGVARRDMEYMIFNSETAIQSERGELSNVAHWHAVMRYLKLPLDDYMQVYKDFFAGDTMDQHLLGFAAGLKPQFKLGLLSNAWENARELLSAQYKFLDIFDASIFSAEVHLRKPESAIYHAMLDLMQVKPQEAIFIDDVQANVDGALAVGMQALRFTDSDTVIATLKERLGITA